MDFDPSMISYSELLDIFWSEHDPEHESYSRQYMSIIFYHNEQQKVAAEASKDMQQKHRNLKIKTAMMPYSVFYIAEDYHQKYYLRVVPEVIREFRRFYPVENDFINSPAAAKVNGYVAGFGSLAN